MVVALFTLMLTRALRQGICGETALGGDCDKGDMGAFGLHPHDAAQGWPRAVQACFTLCSQCTQCHHITVSLKNLDCSWYTTCEPHNQQALRGYRSASFATSGMLKVQPTHILPLPEAIHAATLGNHTSEYEIFVRDLTTALSNRALRPLRAKTLSMIAESSLDFFLREKAHNATNGAWAEFGVFRGGSTRKILQRYTELVAAPAVLHGFDSFRGLPERWDMGEGHWNPGAGSFQVGGKPPFQDGRVRWHAGWYSETAQVWAKELARSGKQISFLHMDADLYSSSAQVFEALEEHLAPGAWIVFDELINYPTFAQHAILALYEMVRRTRRQLVVVGMQGPSIETDTDALGALGRTFMTTWQGSHPQNALVQLL